MSEPLPLPIHPWPLPEGRLDLLREAKARISTDVKVFPTEALPGGTNRVLAFGSVPPFFCEVALVKNVDDVDAVSRALAFYLTAPPGADGLFTEEMWLSAVMGCDVARVE